MYIKITLLTMFTILISCRGERWDDKLILPLQNYDGSQLKIDGYYYSESPEGRLSILFFYCNGTSLYGGSPLTSEIIAKELSFANGEYYNAVKGIKHNWGRFVIDGTSIKREYWPTSTGGSLEAYTVSGEILNDTTFRFTKSWRSCKPKKVQEFEEVFHFKQFSPKPDSTNVYTN